MLYNILYTVVQWWTCMYFYETMWHMYLNYIIIFLNSVYWKEIQWIIPNIQFCPGIKRGIVPAYIYRLKITGLKKGMLCYIRNNVMWKWSTNKFQMDDIEKMGNSILTLLQLFFWSPKWHSILFSICMAAYIDSVQFSKPFFPHNLPNSFRYNNFVLTYLQKSV